VLKRVSDQLGSGKVKLTAQREHDRLRLAIRLDDERARGLGGVAVTRRRPSDFVEHILPGSRRSPAIQLLTVLVHVSPALRCSRHRGLEQRWEVSIWPKRTTDHRLRGGFCGWSEVGRPALPWLRQVTRIKAPIHDIASHFAEPAIAGTGVGAKPDECSIDADPKPLGDHAFRLLNDHATGQRVLELLDHPAGLATCALLR
jgi:hypothetical protein